MRRGLPAFLARSGLLAMLVVSAVYVVLYLYRWEWKRALVAGVFFLASEIAVVGMAVLDRVGRGSHATDRPPTTPDPGARFPWLDPGRLGVFVPILLGAGVLVSLLAWLVERVARLTAPSGPSPLLAGLGDGSGPVQPVAVGGRRPGGVALRVAVVAAAAVLLAGGLRVLADLAQARNEAPTPGRVLVLDLEIRTRGRTETTGVLADRLAVLCVASRFRTEVTPTGSDTVRLAVEPAPGRTDHRVIRGCLEDLVLDRALARVVRAVEVDADQPPPAAVVDPGPGGTTQS